MNTDMQKMIDTMKQSTTWATFDDRMIAEIIFARMYEQNFQHDTSNHLELLIIAKLSEEVERLSVQVTDLLHPDEKVEKTTRCPWISRPEPHEAHQCTLDEGHPGIHKFEWWNEYEELVSQGKLK